MSYIPANLQFSNSIVAPITSRRTLVKIHPQTTGDYKPSSQSKIIFHLPNNKNTLLDLNKSLLAFDLKLGAVTGTLASSTTDYTRAEMASDWIRRLTIRIGNQTVVDINNYNLLKHIIKEATASEDFRSNAATAFLGIGNEAQRAELYKTSTERRFAIPLLMGISSSEAFPSGFINQTLEVTLYLADSKDFVENPKTSVSAVADYTITNVQWLVEQIEPQESYVNALANQLSTSGVQFHFRTYEHHGNILASGHASTSLQVPTRNRSMNMIAFVMRAQNDVNGGTSIQNKLTKYLKNDCESIQYRVNSVLIPQQKIDCKNSAVENYLEFMKAFDHLSSYGGVSLNDHTQITTFEYNGEDEPTGMGTGSLATSATVPKFICAYDFSSYGNDALISGKNLTSASSSLVVDIAFGTNLSAINNIDFFIQYDAILELSTSTTKLLR